MYVFCVVYTEYLSWGKCVFIPLWYTLVSTKLQFLFKAKFIRISRTYHHWLGYSLTEVTLDLFSHIKAKISAPVINLLPAYLRGSHCNQFQPIPAAGTLRIHQPSRRNSFDHKWPGHWTRSTNSLIPHHALSLTGFPMCFQSRLFTFLKATLNSKSILISSGCLRKSFLLFL